MLQAGSWPDLPMKAIAQQIQSRKKAKRKLPQWYDTQGIVFPNTDFLEQSSSEKTAEFKANLIHGKSLADLTGGTGIDSCYFARRFKKVVYNEPGEELYNIARHNFEQLGIGNVTFFNSTAEKFIENNDGSFDWVYLDPSRRVDGQRVFMFQDCQPDVLQLLPSILRTGAKVLLKLSPLLDIHLAQKELGAVSRIIAVSVNNDCKELLFRMENHEGQATFEAVNITNREIVKFDFVASEEEKASVKYDIPAKYLYEPNASVLKLGAFKLIAQRFTLSKLHPNTHLYTSEELIKDFPGRVFNIKKSESFDWKNLKDWKDRKANITTRNFPHSVDAIRKRMGIKEGGDDYLFFARTVNEELITITCQKNWSA